MLKKNPFITIAIPSLNRIDSLKIVIASILEQSYKDFELLIVDDHSDDNIEKYISSLNIPTIRLITNENRLGFKKVYIEALLKARGKYVMTLGNDDILCDKDTLKHIYQKISKREVGLAKLELIYYYKSYYKPCFPTKLENKDIYINKNDYEALFQAVDSYGLTHIAGNIYLRRLLSKESFLDNEIIPFFKTIVDCMVSKGFLLITSEYIAVGMSTSYLSLFSKKKEYKSSWYCVMYHIYCRYLNSANAKAIIVQKIKAQIPYFIAIKSYVGRKEIFRLAIGYITFDKSFLFSLKLYVSVFISLFFPTKLFLFLRDYYYKRKISRYVPPKKYWQMKKVIDTINE